MAIVNKEALVKAVAAETGLSVSDVSKVVDSVQETIMNTVAEGKEVKLMGFLSIEPVLRVPRTYKNPRTGEELSVAESAAVRVRPMKTFRDRVRAAAGELED